MAERFVECVPNFSEGRNPATLRELAEAVTARNDVLLLGSTADPDHHRSVLTFAGEIKAVSAAALRAVAVAHRRIDLRAHAGVHPRLGAADVIPFVPLTGATMADCIALANTTADRIHFELGISCYLYEQAARREDRRKLENVRRTGFEARVGQELDASLKPDFGDSLHETAGACIVGAREFLIAWNVNLKTDDLALAKSIARSIRESSGGLRYVKALGLPLTSRGQVQVSMNLTNFRETPIPKVYCEVARRAADAGVEVAGAELIGFLPVDAWRQVENSGIPFEGLTADSVVEWRLEAWLKDRSAPLP